MDSPPSLTPHDPATSPNAFLPIPNMGNNTTEPPPPNSDTICGPGTTHVPNPILSYSSDRNCLVPLANPYGHDGSTIPNLLHSTSQLGGLPSNGSAILHPSGSPGIAPNSSPDSKWDSSKHRTFSKSKRNVKDTTNDERNPDGDSLTKRNKGFTVQRTIHKKCILICHLNLNKTSVDIRAPVNQEIENFIVILNLTLEVAQGERDQNPTTTLFPMNNSMNFIIWNCRGGNGLEFRRNFRSLLDWHRPPLVALLETKMQDHQTLLEDFDFNYRWRSQQ